MMKKKNIFYGGRKEREKYCRNCRRERKRGGR